MRQDKINKIIESFTFSNNQNNLKDLISRKNYTVNYSSFDFNGNNQNIEEKNNSIFEDTLSKGEISLEKIDQALIDNLKA